MRGFLYTVCLGFSAINGTVTVTFAEAVTEVPEGLVILKDGVDLALAADAFAVADGKVVATVPVVTPTQVEQSVVYSAKVGDGDAVAADAIVIAADTEVPVITTAANTVNVTADQQKVTFTVTDNDAVKTVTAKQGTTDLTVTKEEAADTYSVLVNEVKGANVNLVINATDNAGNAAVEKTVALVDQTKPTITNVQAINNKTIVVTFSEAVADTGVNAANGTFLKADAVKYSLYNKTNGTSVRLTSDTQTDTVQVTATFANAEKTQVKFNIVSVGTSVTGFPNDGLANGGYIFYASNVDDAVANTIIAGSPFEFTGTLTPDSAAPALLSATFNNASGAVTLVFDKPTTGAKPADDKVYFQVGENKVLLKNASDYTGIAGTSTVTFTVDVVASPSTLTKINALGAAPQLVLTAGAFTDGSNPIAEITVTPTITTGPILTQVTYNENTNTAVYKFSKTIDVTKITAFQPAKFNLAGLDIYGGAAAGATFQTTANGTDLTFKLADANAQLVEAAFRAGTKTASVAAGTVQDTEATPNANVAASSAVTLADTDYTKDQTPPTLASAKYNGDSKVLELTFNESVRNTITDYTLASIEFFKDDNGVAGLQTAAAGGVAADTKIATFADTDLSAATNNHGITSTAFRTNATGTTQIGAATVEATTIYIKDQDAGAEKLDGTLDAAVAANKDIYVNILAGGVKDANTNATTAVQSAKVAVNAVSNTSAIDVNTAVANVSLGEITVTFANAGGSVAMDPTLATNSANYDLFLVANPLNKVAIKNIVMETNNTVARIFFSSPVDPGNYALKTSGLKTASGVASDIGGTTAWPSAAWTAATNSSTAKATQDLVLTDVDKSGTVSAGDTVKLIFSEAVKLPAGFAISDITVDNSHSLGNSTFALAADNKTLTITVGSTSTLAVGDKLTFPTTIKNFENVVIATGADQTTKALTVAGNVAATILSAVYTDTNADGVISTGDTLAVKFNQNLAIAATKTAADLIDDVAVGTTTFSAATLSGDTLTLTVNAVGTLAIGDTVTVNGTPANVDLINSWGTKAADAVGKAITASDTVAPTITAFAYNTNTRTLTISFSEAVNVKTAGAPALAKAICNATTGKIAASGGSLGTIDSITDGKLAADAKSFSFVLNTDAAIDQYCTITVGAGNWTFSAGAESIQDASGNLAIRGQGTPYAITIVQ